MRHTILRAAVCAFFAGAAMTASAANPFSDVESDSWAYEAVASLSDQNIVEGYPDGTFKGDKHITRYEMAQITARLLAKRDSLSADQQSVVDKLSREYANDLSSLGVRISELKKKLEKHRFSRNSVYRASTVMITFSKTQKKNTMNWAPASV